MKTCPFCKEEINDEAIKCRYCSTMLVALSSNEPDKSDKVTYVLDRDLIRYIKFSASVVALVIVVGALFYGIDLKQAVRDVRDIQTETQKLSKEVDEAKNTSISTLNDAKRIAKEADDKLKEITQKSEEATGIVANIKLPSGGTVDKQAFGALMSRYLKGVLTPRQLAELEKNINAQELNNTYSVDEVRNLVQADLARAFTFFGQSGLNPPQAKSSVITNPGEGGYTNVYWDGKQVIFGMGMVNSEIFGPYESGLVFHEATHTLFNIKFEGESGAISESICDVMGVVIRGEGWTLGKVRTANPSQSQALRSLQSPGTAYDTPLIGKDPQVSSMKDYVKTDLDFGGIHTNCGILNKAAFLMSEGGNFGGVAISNGIGREKLGRLYLGVIKRLPREANLKFTQFRDLVINTARSMLSTSEVEAVQQGFRAVGL